MKLIDIFPPKIEYNLRVGALVTFSYLSMTAYPALAAVTAPPAPSVESQIGESVTNPKTGEETTVDKLVHGNDLSTPSLVITKDGYVFIVKEHGDLYLSDDESLSIAFEIVRLENGEIEIRPAGQDQGTTSLGTIMTLQEYKALFGSASEGAEGDAATYEVNAGAEDGLIIVKTGKGGKSGSGGTLLIPPSDGKNGNPGGDVDYTNENDQHATSRHGIEAGSVGGAGGKGGWSTLNVWSPGDGGNGGAGGNVTLTNKAVIRTEGDDHHGIYAYSLSGKGGEGGGGFGSPGSGSGGDSNTGGDVKVINTKTGEINTSGNSSHGIFAQSMAGSAGDGGGSYGLVGSGGSGGEAGNGGSVEVENKGSIRTEGKVSHGIFAQSIGGSGGDGGSAGGLVAITGDAEGGGDGGDVIVNHSGSIETNGENSKGIFAQSLGGGGGSGSGGGGLVALGGTGAGGGNAGTVTVINNQNGTIQTKEKGGDGIFAQSVGGSGGSGSTTGGLVAIGGDGANAGHGNDVTVENYGSITTGGDIARGIVAQSIGGGGGDGGNAGGAVAIGGSGAGGGNSGTVSVTHGGDITTHGADSNAIFAQSVGGGGGNGGSSVAAAPFVSVAIGGSGGGGGAGGDVEFTLQGKDDNTNSKIVTEGNRSTAIFAQSVGGGGGNGGGAVSTAVGLEGAVSVGVGGSGGEGGDGGTVHFTGGDGDVDITTHGDDAGGIFVQSVGGGGGNGGYSIASAAAGGLVAGAGVSVSVGGSGGTGGEGGQVTVGTFDDEGEPDMTNPGVTGSITTTADRSTGFIAQSVGGGGGNGGLSVSGSIGVGGTGGAAVGVSLGGSGSSGGKGGEVNVATAIDIFTEGENSVGMLVQSVGGGGGNGGGSVSGTFAAGGAGAGAVSVALGGDGGAGGEGGNVTVYTGESTTITNGKNSTGIIIQSVGGGGGNGGYTVAAGAAGAGAGAGTVGVGLGGSGSVGGEGGEVFADLQSRVKTEGKNSTAILVQSVGGGGGNGGMTVTAGAAGAGTGSGAVNVGLGGDGEGGGDGGTVDAASAGDIETLGENSSGFVAQSVGGGGGNGGFNITTSAAGAGIGSGAVSVGLGGDGAGGGNGGTVTATSTGTITTFADNATAFIAQSVGGGGGSGGFNVSASAAGAGTGSGTVSVGLGGSGAGGGTGGTVVAKSSGDIHTEGENSIGILAQSVGGGGGSGGFNISASAAGAGTGSGAVSVGLGGEGGSGGNGSTVQLIVENSVTTLGDNATGVVAQSVGGGGGNGGFDVSASAAGAGTGSGAISVGIGGSGGDGGTGSNVTNSMIGDIITAGADSIALLVQSIGGGGGNGGFTISAAGAGAGTGAGSAAVGIGGSGGGGGNSGIVTSDYTGDISTFGERSTGVLVQSVGGGGGNGGMTITGSLAAGGTGTGSASVGVGGSGGGGGNAQSVTNTVTGNIYTSGDEAIGIIAQSIGGGGGNGGMSINGAVSLAKKGSGAAAVGIGGSGGEGGDAGWVTNKVTGFIQTLGEHAIGVLTQSVGGGGGNGGLNVSGTITASTKGSGSAAIGVGGFGGDGGDADRAESNVSGTVITAGDNAIGILTQSLGGGGGNGGTNVSGAVNLSKENGGAVGIGVGGFGAGGGDAGEVVSTIGNAENYSYVTTIGDDATGVVAQSLGGGGGNGGTNINGAANITGKSGAAVGIGVGGFGGGGGDAGAVTLNMNGQIITQGDNADGILAQSLGGGGGNGGINISGTLAIALNKEDSTAVGASIGVGGFGGDGGDAGDVHVDFSGIIQTHQVWVPEVIDEETDEILEEGYWIANEGTGSNGLIAQAIAGGGGNGGINVSGGLSYGAQDSDGYSLMVGVGGFGGNGGDAGSVSVNVSESDEGLISAYGDGKSAILAQSIGGGGGNGGLNVSGGIQSDSSLIVGVGGFGGDGGTADDVTVKAITDLLVISEVKTDDEESNSLAHSAGILAQSIGGGGGNGGLNVSGTLSIDKGDVPSITFGLGGFGGDGATSGNVEVDYTGNAQISGDWTHGIFAQSVAGGGGNGGINASGAANWASDSDDSSDSSSAGESGDSSGSSNTDLSIVAGIGGHGGEGANAGDVTVSHSGNIITEGAYSRGIFSQSIGGGGGNGGMNISGTFTKESSPITLGIGGFGEGGGDAGNVTVNRGSEDDAEGRIATNGLGGIGIEATSIGGGGGDAGMNFVMAYSKGSDDSADSDSGNTDSGDRDSSRAHPKHAGVDEEVFVNFDKVLDELEGKSSSEPQQSPDENSSSTFGVQLAIGGSGGGAGDGGEVEVNNFGNIITEQHDSHGILAQSLGGGGGNASCNVAMTDVSNDDNSMGFNFMLGGGTGDGGNGGDVTLSHSGYIETVGDNSYGLFAQSLGGGGGNVGYHKDKLETGSGQVNVMIGRQGGTGGEGGQVELSSDGTIITRGEHSFGILAQSVGGGGGNSSSHTFGFEKSGDEEKNQDSFEASMSIGIAGGEGGDGDSVIAKVKGLVATFGDLSHAVFAQSVGGGGGNAGDVNSSASNVAIGLGASGGTPGVGGEVQVESEADVYTEGESAVGIFAQSVGGGGGNGSMTETEAQSIAIAVGGSGGEGGKGGNVSVANSGEIQTIGAGSHGILAQSIGGGGGNANATKATIVDKKKDEDKSEENSKTSTADNNDSGATEPKEEDKSKLKLAVSIGGSGGIGGESGEIEVSNNGVIYTQGGGAIGIFAQSIGGGGGNAEQTVSDITSKEADNTDITVAIGGSGGEGGTGGSVTVINDTDGAIVTEGDRAHGIMAMSIGGGGGNAASVTAKTEIETDKEASSGAFSLAIGASGAEGGAASNVTVNNRGLIVTYGEQAHGIIAQSIGGGGGNGSVSESGNLLKKDKDGNSNGMGISIGGSGGSSNVGGQVTVDNSGHIGIYGDGSYGILAQSIGGGGGTVNSDIVINDQSSVNLDFDLGGSGIETSGGGNISFRREGDLLASGRQSQGVSIQSIGGGGGSLRLSVEKLKQELGDNEEEEGGVPALAPMLAGFDKSGSLYSGGTITLGGSNVTKSHGGNIDLTFEGMTATLEDYSTAMVIQSIGGGGGQANLEGYDYLDISFGATGGSSADGGDISIANTGDIFTAGATSHAVTIQSIGGGGGLIIANAAADSLTTSKNSDNSGDGGDIEFNQTGAIWAEGDDAIAVLVQSLGGGGGTVNNLFMDSAGGAGSAGDISLSFAGDIAATGNNGIAVFAQSKGRDGQGNIQMDLAEGWNLVFGSGGTGVWFSGGRDNSLVNNGIVLGSDRLSGNIFRGDEGNNAITNNGLIWGQFDLGNGINSFANSEDGVFIGGENLYLGAAGNTFTNSGIFLSGDPEEGEMMSGYADYARFMPNDDYIYYSDFLNKAQHIYLTGSFEQTATGVTYAELDFGSTVPLDSGAAAMDSLHATGSVHLDGELVLTLLNPQNVPVGRFEQTLFSGDQWVFDNGLILTTAPSVVINYNLLYQSTNQATPRLMATDAAAFSSNYDNVVVQYNVNFAPDGMSQNLLAVGEYFNDIQRAGGSEELADTIVQLLYMPDLASYKAPLSDLSPEFYGEVQAEMIRSSQQFSRLMASSYGYRFMEKGRGFWMGYDHDDTVHNPDGDFKEARHYLNRFSVGYEHEYSPDWSFGFALGLDDIDSSGYRGRWDSDGTMKQFGLYARRDMGDTQLSFTANFGWGDHKTKRSVDMLDSSPSSWAKSKRNLHTYGAMFRASHVFVNDGIYANPLVDVGITGLDAKSTTETVSDMNGFSLHDYSETHSWIHPALAGGYRFSLNGMKVDLYGSMELHHYFDGGSSDVIAGVNGDLYSGAAMTIPIDLGDTYAEVGAGAKFMTSEKVSFGVEYKEILDHRYDISRLNFWLNVLF